MNDYGALCVIPPLVVIALAIWLKRAFEPLLIGCLVGFLIISPHDFPARFLEGLMQTLQSEDMVWIILICSMYGALIQLIIESGGVVAFGNWALQFVKTRRQSLLLTWLVGVIIFVDDYMSALSTGVIMRKITDNFGVPRKTLAFLVAALSPPICILVPMSTWAIYVGKLLETNKIVPANGGIDGFMLALPYMFYGWVIVAIALWVAWRSGNDPVSIDSTSSVAVAEVTHTKGKAAYFFLPLVVLIAATLLLDKDALKGVIVSVFFTFLYYWLMRVMTFTVITDHIFEGFKSMIFALGILTMSFLLKKVGDNLGLTPYVITSVKPFLSKEVLAAAVFVTLSFISYTTASSWGMYAVALPIVLPLAQALGADVWLAAGAVISAGAFGSQASFYSDVSVLTAASTESDSMENNLTSMPYNVLALGLSAVLFLIFGFIL